MASVSLVVFDPTVAGHDERRAIDNILYFFPESTPDNTRMNHVGLCIAVGGLAYRFSDITPSFMCTDGSITVIHAPRGDGEVCIAATFPFTGKTREVASRKDVAADRFAAAATDALATVFQTYLFRFGEEGLRSKTSLQHFFDRFCTSVLPKLDFNDHAQSSTSASEATFSVLSGLRINHAPEERISKSDYYLLKSLVAHYIPCCPAFVIISDDATLVSTADGRVTAAVTLLHSLFGPELSTFTCTLAEVKLDCHVIHCGHHHTFVALCDSASEHAVTRCAAEMFQACDDLRKHPRIQSRSRSGNGTKQPSAALAVANGCRAGYVGDAAKLAAVQFLCGTVMALHRRCHSEETDPETAFGPMMIRRAPLTTSLPRCRPSTIANVDANTCEEVVLVSKDTWVVVRHADRRTVGMCFNDAVSWSDIADSVDRAHTQLL